MKHKINYLGFLSLLALIAIMGFTTDNDGLYGFFGFAFHRGFVFIWCEERCEFVFGNATLLDEFPDFAQKFFLVVHGTAFLTNDFRQSRLALPPIATCLIHIFRQYNKKPVLQEQNGLFTSHRVANPNWGFPPTRHAEETKQNSTSRSMGFVGFES